MSGSLAKTSRHAPGLLLVMLGGLGGCEHANPWSCEETGGHASPGVVDAAQDLEQLRGVERVCGDLRITGPLTTVDALEALRVVEGSLVIADSAIEVLALPSLVEVEGHLGLTNNTILTNIDLPRLESVGGELAVADNPALIHIDADDLHDVGSSLLLANNVSLPEFLTPGLVEVDALHVSGNSALEAYSIPPALVQVESVIITQNDALHTVRGGEALESVGEIVLVENAGLQAIELSITGEIESLRIAENPALTEVAGIEKARSIEWLIVIDNATLTSLPGLGPVSEMTILYIAHNPALQQLGASAVERIGFVGITHNELLDPNEVSAALDGVEVGFLKVDGNAGQPVPHLDSCPWMEDGECDESENMSGYPGTGLCALDPVDCAY